MPIKSFAFSVTTAAQLVVHPTTTRTIAVAASAAAPVPVALDNTNGSASVYWGGSDVTTSNGVVVPVGTQFFLELQPGDDLYLIAGSATSIIVAAGRQ